MTIRTLFYRALITLSLLLIGLFAAVWFSTFHPADTQSETVFCPANAPVLAAGQPLKVYNQNVQFMAGKNYVFFYDLPANSGPDDRPSTADISQTLHGLANLIKQQAPDIILLQEVDDGAKRTDYADQLADLLKLLPNDYACHASSFYWQGAYVPHPRIMGAVGTKLSIISKYKITAATRTQLSLIPQDPINQLFNFKRALLDVRLPVSNSTEIAILNTHLSAFSKGTLTLSKQVSEMHRYLETLNKANKTWIAGGDFNLLPPNHYPLLAEKQRAAFERNTQIQLLYDHYAAIPSIHSTESTQHDQWFTYFPNNPVIKQPDRIIDYLFYSRQLSLNDAFIEQEKSLLLSDHMPIIATFTLP